MNPARALDWLRGVLGESAELARTRADRDDARARLGEATAKLGPAQIAASSRARALVAAREAADQADRARQTAEARAVAAVLDRDAALRRAAGADAAIAKAFQPERSPACNKQQLPDRETAEWWAAKVADDLGEEADAFTVYACQWCPRNPLTGNRWLHIGHVDPEKRTSNLAGRRAQVQAERAKHRRAGRMLHQRPDVVEALRDRGRATVQ